MTIVCIAGMHRSGTSMVARLLNLCGLYLGEEADILSPDSDNTEGFWENRQFLAINEEILSRLGAGWDFPSSIQPGWELRPEMMPLRLKAAELLKQFSTHELWGWKDPRNSITLPFWQQLVPNMRVVICLRNPIAVARSLFQRNYFSQAASFNLWLAYNIQLCSFIVPHNRIVTHYDSYFHDPLAELRRIVQLLEIDVSQELVEDAVDTVSLPLQHHRATLLDLVRANPPENVVDLYGEMCAQSGPVYQLVSKDEPLSLDELPQLRKEFILNEHITGLEVKAIEKAREIGALESWLGEKEHAVQVLTGQLGEKEHAVQVLTAQLAEKELVEQSRMVQVEQIEHELLEHKRSRAWRVAMFLRRIRVLLIPPGSPQARIFGRALSFGRMVQSRKNLDLIRRSTLFDAPWYLASNPDVAESGINPALHYLQFGGFEGRDPSPKFSSSSYLAANKDVEQARINPLLHYMKHGKGEGRLVLPNAVMQVESIVTFPYMSGPMPRPSQSPSGDIRTVSFYSHSSTDALAYLRLLGPARQAGLRIINGVENGRVYVDRATQGDVVVLQRDFPVHLVAYEEILALAHDDGKPVILELDDLLLELPEDHPDRLTHHYAKALLPILQALTEVDLVTVATLPLREYVLPYNKNVVVLPNYLDDGLWRLQSPSSRAVQKDAIVIGYMGGITHVPDLEMIVPALLDLNKRHPGKLQFRFWGLQPPKAMRSMPNAQWYACDLAAYPAFAEYFQRQSADIFIAPLRDNLFNACKSPIKYFEYSAVGAPGVYSRIDPYSNVIMDGFSGLLASSLSDWTEALNRLIEDPELRLAIARNAQASIRSNWLLSNGAAKWLKTYEMAAKVFVREEHVASSFRGLAKSLAHQVAEERDEIAGVQQKEPGLMEAGGSRVRQAGMLLRRLRALLSPPGSLLARTLSRALSFGRMVQSRKNLDLIRRSTLFDAPWYLASNPDVAESGISPGLHYLQFGGFEGRDPSPKFSSSWYLATNKDVEQARVNPLLHYMKHGKGEGRSALPSKEAVVATHRTARGSAGWQDRRGNSLIVHYLRRAFDTWKLGGPALVWEKTRSRLARPVSVSYNSDAALSDDEQKREVESFHFRPLISILMPVYNTPSHYLTAAINSILQQTYTDFEICICDDGSSDPTVAKKLQAIAKQDKRVKVFISRNNTGIAAATNKAAELAHGDFYAFMDHDDELTPNALFEVVQLLNQDPLADVIYSDQDKIDTRGSISEHFYKPDWSPEYFRSAMYVGHLLVVKNDLFHQVDGMLSRFDGVQDYEFMLRTSEIAKRIRHIHKILYHWRKIPGSIAWGVDEKGDRIEELQVKAVSEQLRRLNIPAIATINPSQRHRVIILPKPRANFPLVSIIITAENNPAGIGRCLQSIFERTSYPNYQVVAVADQATVKTAWEVLNIHPVKVVSLDEKSGFSKAYNLGVQSAQGEFVVLLDNDTEVLTAEWIEVLLSYLEREGVGAVGPMLIFPNHTVQHAGIALGIHGTADHVMRRIPYTSDGYAGSLCCPREVSAVTGACMMLRRKDFMELGGLVEYYATQYQDVDLCLRILQTGRRILYVPHAILLHYESLASGASYDRIDRALFLDTWGDMVAQGDPYYNPHFSLDRGDYSFNREERV